MVGVVLAMATACSSGSDDPTGSAAGDGVGAPISPASLPNPLDPDQTPGTRTGGGDPALGPSVTRVTGTVAIGTVIGVLDDPVPTPLVLTVPSSGGGNGAVVDGIEVDGRSATLVWDGGRPLTLDGVGTMTVQSDTFRIEAGRVVAALGGFAHPLAAGSYRLDGPVAIGDDSGLARPSDSTSFTAVATAVIRGTGTSDVRLPDQALQLFGPGIVSLTGTFRVQTEDSVNDAAMVTATDASFELRLEPDGERLRVTMLVQGALEVS